MDSFVYPPKEAILGIHEDIIREDEDAEPGVTSPGGIDFVLDYVAEGFKGEGPKTLHEKGFEFMRMLAANHYFVDGNKRTALNTVTTFYFLNGKYLNYGEEVKAVLKLLAVMESMVDGEKVKKHFEDVTISIGEAGYDEKVVGVVELINKLYRLNSKREELLEDCGILEITKNIEELEQAIESSEEGKEDIPNLINETFDLGADIEDTIEEMYELTSQIKGILLIFESSIVEAGMEGYDEEAFANLKEEIESEEEKLEVTEELLETLKGNF